MQRFIFTFSLIFLFAVGGCSGKKEKRQTLVLTGSSTLAPLAEAIGKRYEKTHPEIRIDVQTGGSSRGIRDIHAKACDIGMSSRSLHPDEMEGMQVKTVAWDGVAFLLNASNKVENLTPTQLRNIYTGKTENWKEVGGNDAPIVVSNRAEGRSELELISKFLAIEPKDIQADMIDGETEQSIKTVINNQNAITYTSLGAAEYARNHGEPLKLLPLKGVSATTLHVQEGAYPLSRPLLMIQPVDGSKEAVNAFLQYALSDAVDDLTKGLGYVPPVRK